MIRIGGAQCRTDTPGASWGHSTVVCTCPQGSGANLAVTMVVGTQSPAITPATFSYDPPAISLLLPTFGATAGGQIVSIYGSNFGTSAVVEFLSALGTRNCVLTSIGQSDSQLACVVPAGEGRGVSVQMVVAGQRSQIYAGTIYNYNAPTISAMAPITGPTSGGDRVELVGTHFGVNTSTNWTLHVGAFPVPVLLTRTDTRIEFVSPIGSGTNLPVTLVIAGQTAVTLVRYSYAAPQLTSVAGCVDEPPATKLCPVAGGTTLLIVGTSFGVVSAHKHFPFPFAFYIIRRDRSQLDFTPPPSSSRADDPAD